MEGAIWPGDQTAQALALIGEISELVTEVRLALLH